MARAADELLTIGQVAARSGVSVPTIRYYEERGLVVSARTASNHRRFPRHVLRRLAVVAAGQRVGLTLAEIGDALAELPADRAPSRREWHRMSSSWGRLVAARIAELERLSRSLDECIGCGCLSLGRCALFNPSDEAGREGPGSRWLREADGAARAVRATSHRPVVASPGTR